jgi:hypothetical protein
MRRCLWGAHRYQRGVGRWEGFVESSRLGRLRKHFNQPNGDGDGRCPSLGLGASIATVLLGSWCAQATQKKGCGKRRANRGQFELCSMLANASAPHPTTVEISNVQPSPPTSPRGGYGLSGSPSESLHPNCRSSRTIMVKQWSKTPGTAASPSIAPTPRIWQTVMVRPSWSPSPPSDHDRKMQARVHGIPHSTESGCI